MTTFSQSDLVQFWAERVETAWGGQATLEMLYGEHDLNFRLIDAHGVSRIVKVMRAGCEAAELDYQIAMMGRLSDVPGVPVSRVVPTMAGKAYTQLSDEHGHPRFIWQIAMLPGATLDHHKLTISLVEQIGATAAHMHQALQDFEHPGLHRDIKWDLRAANWIGDYLSVFDDKPAVQSQIRDLLEWYREDGQPLLRSLPAQAIHNDLNQQNLLATHGVGVGPQLSGVIDFGDSLYSPKIVDLAIAGAYLAMDQDQPVEAVAALVTGYCQVLPLSAAELDALWPLLLMRLAVSVTNSGLRKVEFPNDPYVVISEKPALDLLAFARDLDPRLVALRLRHAAQLPIDTLSALDVPAPECAMFNVDVTDANVLDLTPNNVQLAANKIQPDPRELELVVQDASRGANVVLGRYGEARLIYGGAAFGPTDHLARRRRTIHIGVDVFLPAGTDVRAVLPGKVVSASYRPDAHDYGGTLIVEHAGANGVPFRALYGHLSKASVDRAPVGRVFAAGDVVAYLGAVEENGGWPPHLHFQISGMDAPLNPGLWPGVVDPDSWDLWQALYPNPARLLGVADGILDARPSKTADMQKRRGAVTAANLKLSYRDPIHMVRGQGSILVDADGRRYLDAYNNVPHVGHAHPHVAGQIAAQVQRLSTNTRYLSDLHLDYVEHLLSLFPSDLDTCFLVNSGSEANEVAMRLASTYTGRKDMAVSEVGYHGITQKTLEISHYKFAGPGGQGQADWVHVLPIPNTFSGPFQGLDAGQQYAQQAASLIGSIGEDQQTLAGCFLEIFPSVGGQLIPPSGYLASLEQAVKKEGALFIADEVQTGLGRLGHHMWAFEQQGLKPDIVVLGKPIGNGHPMGAVITRKEIADTFSNGMEFFSTFGGSTVSCAAGKAVLEVMEAENLPDRAAKSGAMLLEGLTSLFANTPLNVDVRGLGLFLGIEVCHEDGTPATELVGDFVNAMRQRRVLIGSDGPHDSVLKIRPPICFEEADATFFLEAMDDSMKARGLR